ncbi:MAG: hypothetical protein ACP5Q4_09895 [Candidatus Caldatribacteriaceae bacterium]
MFGKIKDDVYEKAITERSIFRNSNSWGTEKEVLEELRRRGVKVIRLLRRDTREVLEIPLGEFLEHAFTLHLPGKPPQLLCQLRHFKERGRDTSWNAS